MQTMLNNKIAQEGCDRCYCGCKYWENDTCIDCGEGIGQVLRWRLNELEDQGVPNAVCPDSGAELPDLIKRDRVHGFTETTTNASGSVAYKIP